VSSLDTPEDASRPATVDARERIPNAGPTYGRAKDFGELSRAVHLGLGSEDAANGAKRPASPSGIQRRRRVIKEA